MAARTFIWITAGGGAWALAANWDDVTDGISPSQLVPGTQDNVTVTGPSFMSVDAITGLGAVASALFSGNTILSGNFTAATLTVGNSTTGGLLQLAAGTSLQSSSAMLAGGSLLANGTATQLGVAGLLTLGSAQGGLYGASASLDVTAGGHASVLGVLMNTGSSQIYVDPNSIMEIGQLGTGARGKLTLDPGKLLAGQGGADAYGAIANGGTILANGGTLELGSVSGTGVLQIGAGATLEANGAIGAGQAVVFAGANATLALDAEFYTPGGTVTGYAPGDVIDYAGGLISAAVFTGTGADTGMLTLYYGTQVAARINLAGNFTGSAFLTSGDGAGGTLVEVAPAVAGGGPPSLGTTAPDQYLWTATGSGAWKSAANWQDQTTGAAPAAIAPGAHNIVTISAAQGSFSVIAGPANAASLSVVGEVALSGAYGIGTLSIGDVDGSDFTPGALDLLAGASIGAATAGIGSGAIAVAGSGAQLSVAGTLTLGGGFSGVGLPVTALTATAGGTVQAASLMIGGGSGDSITTDTSGSVEIGTLGKAAAGAVTVDPGATITGNGSINPLGPVIDNGAILATGGNLILGSVTGTGALSIGSGALELSYATALPIAFTSATSTLAIGGEGSIPTGTLSGIVVGDVIDLLGSPISNLQFIANTGSNGGTMLLIYDGNAVGRLTTSSNFNHEAFVLNPDGFGGTNIVVAPLSGGGGGTGQTGTDPLVWNGSINSAWSLGGNWNDTITGKIATLPPGTQTPATIAGPAGTDFQSISGTGTSASLALTGNAFFYGNFAIGNFSLGQDATPNAAAVSGTLVTSALTTFTLSQALVADGAFLIAGNKTVVDVGGTLALGDGGGAPNLSVTQHAAGQFGALSLGGGSVSVDSSSTLEIGTLGIATNGTLTIDPGFIASGFGTLDVLGSITDNGTITAAGGTLVVGPVSGAGSLSIATEASLDVAGTESLPIAVTGAGATLSLESASATVTGVIAGFAPGDSIVTGNTPVDTVLYQPGAGGVGTLTLSEAGQTVASLALAGNYAGKSFSVQPDGQGAVIIVTAPAASAGTTGSPPAGTVTPDQYNWSGADGLLWSDVNNWSDTTQAQTPAAVAPGQNDSITIDVPVGGAQEVIGPADAASLSFLGTLSLAGDFGIGTLTGGNTLQKGFLELGAGDVIDVASASIIGGIAGQGGTLSVGGTLSLGQAARSGGLVSVTRQSALTAGTVLLNGFGGGITTDATGSVEIGGIATAAPGTVSVDASGELVGAGAVNPAGQVVDNGTITASGGTLALGAISGSGTVLVGVGATMILESVVAAGLTVDFAASGTLDLLGAVAGFAGAIEDFGPGDQIILPVSGANAAAYATTGPGIGELSIFDGTQLLDQLTLLGSQADLVFSVAGSAGGGTILTATPANTAGEGGGTMANYPTVTGGFQITPEELFALAPFAETYLQALNDGPPNYNQGIYEFFLAGDTTVVSPPFFSPTTQPGLDAEVVGPLTGEVGPGGFGPGSNVVLQPGYTALIAEGSDPINLIDQSIGGAILASNAGADILTDLANNDTLVGAPGANTVFFASGGAYVTIQGGGDDTITSTDNSQITTSPDQSEVFLGSADNSVESGGSDRIICAGLGIANDTVTGLASAGQAGDTVFGPVQGSLIYDGGGAPATVVGGGGQVIMTGGAGNGNILWAGNSYVQYDGGSGSAIVVGGDQPMVVQGGTAPMTVFGSTGLTEITGTPGHSIFLAGFGPTTISAATGNTVWLIGSAPVSVAAANGALVYAGASTGDNIFQANAGSETLWGGAGNDSFFAGSGSGTFVSGGGADAFNFTNGLGGGSDVIVGFVPGLDTISLHGYGNSTPAFSVSAGSTYFTLSDGTKVELYAVTDMTPSSFSTV